MKTPFSDASASEGESEIHRESHFDGSLPYAYGPPSNSGWIKADPDDFVVDEILRFPLRHEGEHSYLRIEKIGENTEHVARLLAGFADIPRLHVGYAGLKDRQARTRQWFSLSLAGKVEPAWAEFPTITIRIIETTRHPSKLRRGDLAGNRFQITVREVTGPREAIEERLDLISRCGVPNYYGPQRFGRAGGNLEMARELFLGSREVRSRHHRGLYLSAARSHLFNRILARRVECGIWNRPVPGDVLMAGPDDRPTRHWPAADELDRLMSSAALHPAGTLWGRGRSWTSGQALALEQDALKDCRWLCDGLEAVGMERAMRPLRAAVKDLAWQFPKSSTLELRFMLPPGAYATSVLREVFVNSDELSLPE